MKHLQEFINEQIEDSCKSITFDFTDLEDAVAANETAAIITIAGEIVAKTEERNRKLKMAN